MKFFEWLKSHKTAISAYIIAAGAMIELSPARDVIFRSPSAYALFTLVTGLVVLAIGTFNTQANTEAAVQKVADKIVEKQDGPQRYDI